MCLDLRVGCVSLRKCDFFKGRESMCLILRVGCVSLREGKVFACFYLKD